MEFEMPEGHFQNERGPGLTAELLEQLDCYC